MACLLITASVAIIYKINLIENQIKTVHGDLYNPYGCGLYRTSDIYDAAVRTAKYAKAYNADVIVIRSDHRALAYVIDAMYYGDFIVYNITYDRRTWNYQYLRHQKPHICAFVDYSSGEVSVYFRKIDKQSVVDYIAEYYGAYRNPYLRQ